MTIFLRYDYRFYNGRWIDSAPLNIPTPVFLRGAFLITDGVFLMGGGAFLMSGGAFLMGGGVGSMKKPRSAAWL